MVVLKCSYTRFTIENNADLYRKFLSEVEKCNLLSKESNNEKVELLVQISKNIYPTKKHHTADPLIEFFQLFHTEITNDLKLERNQRSKVEAPNIRLWNLQLEIAIRKFQKYENLMLHHVSEDEVPIPSVKIRTEVLAELQKNYPKYNYIDDDIRIAGTLYLVAKLYNIDWRQSPKVRSLKDPKLIEWLQKTKPSLDLLPVHFSNKRRLTDIDETVIFQQKKRKTEESQVELSDSATTEREAAKQAQRSLWKIKKDLSNENVWTTVPITESAEKKIQNSEKENKRLNTLLVKKCQGEEKELSNENVWITVPITESAEKKIQNSEKENKRLNTLLVKKCQGEEKELSNENVWITVPITESAEKKIQNSEKENKRLNTLPVKKGQGEETVNNLLKELESILRRLILNAGNERLTSATSRYNEEISQLKAKIDLLNKSRIALEKELIRYEKLTNDHETRENTLIQDKMKLLRELENIEQELKKTKIGQNKEKMQRLEAEKSMERLRSEIRDLESERNSLVAQRDQYKKLTQDLNNQIAQLTSRCGKFKCNIAGTHQNS